MKLIVGLGNPGQKYEHTRHNVGFIILDSYLKDTKWIQEKDCEYQILNINGEKVCFLRPLTYMNLSGQAVLRIVNYYKILVNDILVIHDDLALDIGKHKFKTSSSAGGHNGVKNIIEVLSSQEFNHLKVGIGHNKNIATADYVLNKLSTAEIKELKSDKYIEMINYYLENGIEKAMNKYNGE